MSVTDASAFASSVITSGETASSPPAAVIASAIVKNFSVPTCAT